LLTIYGVSKLKLLPSKNISCKTKQKAPYSVPEGNIKAILWMKCANTISVTRISPILEHYN
jgi:hypothetical protein